VTHIELRVRDRLRELRALRDELRVQAHLAGLDARVAWDRLREETSTAERAAEHACESALTRLEHTIDDLRSTLTKLTRTHHDPR
jgi:hypothetical protein